MKFMKKVLSLALAGSLAFSAAAAFNVTDVLAVAKIKNTAGVGTVDDGGMYVLDLVSDAKADPDKVSKVEVTLTGDASQGFGGGIMFNGTKCGWDQKDSYYWGNEGQPIIAKSISGDSYSLVIDVPSGKFGPVTNDDYYAQICIQQWWQDAAPITITGVKVFAGSEQVYPAAAPAETAAPAAAAEAQTITVSGKSKTFKAADVAKADQTFNVKASAKTDVSFKAKSDKTKSVSIDAAGKVTVKKGTAAGTYKIATKAIAKATDAYKKATKKVTVKVVVK